MARAVRKNKDSHRKGHGTLSGDYRKSGSYRLSGGYGGFHCPCCNQYGCPRDAKPLVRRRLRRIDRQRLERSLAVED